MATPTQALAGEAGPSSNPSADFEARVIGSLAQLSAAVDTKLAGFKQELLTEQKEENERMTKRLKLEKKFQFKKKGPKCNMISMSR